MSRQEAERIAAQGIATASGCTEEPGGPCRAVWADGSCGCKDEAVAAVAALADAGLLADPAKNDEPSWSAAGGPCALCGRDPAAGYASSFDGDKAIWLCHDSAKRTCYVRWTVYDERPAAGTPEEQTPDERQTR